MKPLGRKHGPSAKDVHPPKGYVNWWEVVTDVSNTSARQKNKQEIREEIRGISRDL